MPKNRLGQKLAFRMRLNFDQAAFREIAMPSSDEDSGG